MAGITLLQAELRLQSYLAAEEAVLSGQAYAIAGRQMTRANLKEIRDGIEIWDNRVKNLALKSSGLRRSVSSSPRW